MAVKIAAFLASNLIGFFSVVICYVVGLRTGLLDLSAPSFDPEYFRIYFFTGIPAVWLICALLSIAFFFVKNQARFIFLLAPLVTPMAYGFSVLYGLP